MSNTRLDLYVLHLVDVSIRFNLHTTKTYFLTKHACSNGSFFYPTSPIFTPLYFSANERVFNILIH